MVDYIVNILENILVYMKGEPATPAVYHLFDTSEYLTKLSQTDAELLHNLVENLLYLSKIAQQDIHSEIYFLWTIVIEHSVDNYKKLESVMKYIQGNIGLPLILSMEKYGNIKWYVDV